MSGDRQDPPVRTERQEAGDRAEAFVADHLSACGWTILARNVRGGRGELDLIAIDPGPPRTLVVVEIRWRASRSFGLAEETVAFRKRAHLRAAVGRVLEDGLPDGRTLPGLPLRIDLVAVEPPLEPGEPPRIRHHRAAV
jgi:putative endonuclease